jgi:sporulation protein YlmC with PRC-barrel domain
MVMKLSKLFGMDIYSDKAEYKGKIFDIVINLEKGRLETITTEALRAKSKQEAKKIISDKSIPYRNVKAIKDMVLVSTKTIPEEVEEKPAPSYRARLRR